MHTYHACISLDQKKKKIIVVILINIYCAHTLCPKTGPNTLFLIISSNYKEVGTITIFIL